jgi:hypothetical protein
MWIGIKCVRGALLANASHMIHYNDVVYWLARTAEVAILIPHLTTFLCNSKDIVGSYKLTFLYQMIETNSFFLPRKC